MERTIIPIPPSHCVRLLQRRILCGSPSTSVITLAPVVVNPDIDSKQAFVKPGIDPEKRYGRVPNKPEIIHPSATIATASRWFRETLPCFLINRKIIRPIRVVTSEEERIAIELPSLKARETPNGNPIEIPRKMVRIAMKRIMTSRCIIRSIPV
jgi:hypothetical protein